jgi:hypothetical protein
MYTLPAWMQWLQALALIAISGLGAWIAFKQVRIGTAKLNLDLYDKRFRVFETARTLLVAIFQHGEVRQAEINAFNLGVSDAIFLFDESIDEYLVDLRKRVNILYLLRSETKAAEGNQERFSQLVDKSGEHFLKLVDELPILIAKFKPFLKLGNI